MLYTCMFNLIYLVLSHIFPQRLPNVFRPTSEEMRIDNENTLRAIFGEDYSDELVKNILSEMPQAPNLNDTLDNIAAPIILSEPADNAVPQTLEVLATGSNDNNTMYSHEVNNNDNNMYSHTHTFFEKDFGKLIRTYHFSFLLSMSP